VKNTSQEHLLSDKNTQEQALRVTLKSLQTELEASSAQILQVNSKSQHAGEIEAKLNVEIASLRTEHEREQKKMIDIKDLHDKANMQLEVERAKFETFVISKKELQVEADSLRESLKEALNARAENKEELSAAQTGTPPGDGHTEDHLSKSQALQSVNEDLEAQLKSLRDQLDTLRKVDSNTAQPPSLQTATDAPSGASVGSADNTAKQNKKKSSTRKAAPCVVS
jgi:chromosome segregation ATPase